MQSGRNLPVIPGCLDGFCWPCGQWSENVSRQTAWCGSCDADWIEQHRQWPSLAILDGCCGAGGATRGYINAGHDVWGVDNSTDPRMREDYLATGAQEFIKADILEVLSDKAFLSRFDAVHLGTPCQSKSRMSNCRRGLAETYENLIPDARELLLANFTGPWIIENVAGMRPYMRDPVTLCCWGHFGREGYRHRLFETHSFTLDVPVAPAGAGRPNPECGWPHPVTAAKAGHWEPGKFVSVAGHERREPVQRVMETPWMRNREHVKEAIPPYMAEFIGRQLRTGSRPSAASAAGYAGPGVLRPGSALPS